MLTLLDSLSLRLVVCRYLYNLLCFFYYLGITCIFSECYNRRVVLGFSRCKGGDSRIGYILILLDISELGEALLLSYMFCGQIGCLVELSSDGGFLGLCLIKAFFPKTYFPV